MLVFAPVEPLPRYPRPCGTCSFLLLNVVLAHNRKEGRFCRSSGASRQHSTAPRRLGRSPPGLAGPPLVLRHQTLVASPGTPLRIKRGAPHCPSNRQPMRALPVDPRLTHRSTHSCSVISDRPSLSCPLARTFSSPPSSSSLIPGTEIRVAVPTLRLAPSNPLLCKYASVGSMWLAPTCTS